MREDERLAHFRSQAAHGWLTPDAEWLVAFAEREHRLADLARTYVKDLDETHFAVESHRALFDAVRAEREEEDER